MELDLSTEAQGKRIRSLYRKEIELKNSRKTMMLSEIPSPPDIRFSFTKHKKTDKKMNSKSVKVEPPVNPENVDKINKIILYIEKDFIEPILKESMSLFRAQIKEVLKGNCKKDGKEYKALVRFSYKLSMNLEDIYNIKGDFHETTDEKLKSTFERLNKLYYAPAPKPVIVAIPIIEEDDEEEEEPQEYLECHEEDYRDDYEREY